MSQRCYFEDEKKEGAHGKRAAGEEETDHRTVATHSNSDEQLQELSPDLLKLLGVNRRYRSEEELQKTLDEAGLGDLRVTLVRGKLFQVMPRHQHNAFTTKYANDFGNWRRNLLGNWESAAQHTKFNFPMGDRVIRIWAFGAIPVAIPSARRPTLKMLYRMQLFNLVGRTECGTKRSPLMT